MGELPDRIRGKYAAEYGFPTDPFDLPPADVLSRVVEGLHGLDSEPSWRRGSASSDAGNREGGALPDRYTGGGE